MASQGALVILGCLYWVADDQLMAAEPWCLSDYLSALKLDHMLEFIMQLIATQVLQTELSSFSQIIEAVDLTLCSTSFKHHLYTIHCIQNNCLFCQKLDT